MKKSLGIFVTGMTVGICIGMSIYPEMDRRTKRNVKKAKRKIRNTMEDSYDSLMDIIN